MAKMDITDKAFGALAEIVEKKPGLTNDQKIKFCSEYMKIFASVYKEIQSVTDTNGSENVHLDNNKMETDTAEEKEDVDEDELENAMTRYLATLVNVTDKRKTYPPKLKLLLGKGTRNQINAVERQSVAIAPYAHLEVGDDVEYAESQIKSLQETGSSVLSDGMVNLQPHIERLTNQGVGLDIVYGNRGAFTFDVISEHCRLKRDH